MLRRFRDTESGKLPAPKGKERQKELKGQHRLERTKGDKKERKRITPIYGWRILEMTVRK